MFVEFANQVWSPEDASVIVTDNTDSSIDGSCKKVAWTDALGKTLVISFTDINLSEWEEISLHIFPRDLIARGDIFKITVDGNDFSFTKNEFRKNKWNHILIDCANMATITQITFTALVPGITLAIDYMGCRKVTYDCDLDIIQALKSHIQLDYDVETTLNADVAIGDISIDFASNAYINDTSLIELDDGAGTKENAELLSRNGTLKEPLAHAFDSGSIVRVLCPVRGEDLDDIEPDPVCGVKVWDIQAEKREDTMTAKNSTKTREYLGRLGIIVYIDCGHKKKLLQMARQYNKRYGKEFQFLLDGEQVDVYMESSLFADEMIGNNMRMAYYYRIEPQPFILALPTPITTFVMTMQSQPILSMTEVVS
jgi:hypothetical protein